MATRRRRNPATNTETVSAHIPDGAWDDFSSKAPELTLPDGAWEDFSSVTPELTHEEPAIEEEEKAMEVFLAMAAADTFEALQKAEEEKGLDGFFDPHFYETPAPAPQTRREKRPRYILRSENRRRKA
jgi:hypothetical protein